ncbi:MAG: hypothetical protein K9I36_16775 [Bacteroidia bacterium]|nr:hypothetical protein [Bacteroidia bacterium]
MFCKNLFIKSKNSGLGEPISITTVILISAVSVAIITYFVTKYYNDTVNGYNSTLKLIQDINKDNPELASQLANQVADVQKNKDDSSFMSQLGTGLKWAAGLIGFGGLLYLGSKSYDSYKKHKK